ncbi:hypothetical protein [Micromonospora sp. NPDC049799]|uniref:hypothetical protein n=1 Tax=Micromonospora sp. NPDC049799 TaxID=3154741 RepID=UPI00340047AE
MTRTALLAAGTALLALTACAATPTPARPAGEVTVVGFTETSHEPGGAAYETRVSVHLAHHDGILDAMRFETRTGGSLVEERLWRSDRPDTVAVRSWPECRQSNEPMPPPRPETVEQVLTEYFGPRTPAGTPATDGRTSWTDRPDGGIVRTFTDDGSGYPGGRTVTIGADGDAGTTIGAATVAPATELSGWTPGWDVCVPYA